MSKRFSHFRYFLFSCRLISSFQISRIMLFARVLRPKHLYNRRRSQKARFPSQQVASASILFRLGDKTEGTRKRISNRCVCLRARTVSARSNNLKPQLLIKDRTTQRMRMRTCLSLEIISLLRLDVMSIHGTWAELRSHKILSASVVLYLGLDWER